MNFFQKDLIIVNNEGQKLEAVSSGNLLTKVTSEGTKFDSEKLRVELLPSVALEEISKVLTFGAKKYDSWNWAKGISWGRLLGASLRHLFAFMRGEDKDPESGLSHLAHLGCCVVFLLWHERFRKDLDDRHRDPDCRSNT